MVKRNDHAIESSVEIIAVNASTANNANKKATIDDRRLLLVPSEVYITF
jgi:hypothetical protein